MTGRIEWGIDPRKDDHPCITNSIDELGNIMRSHNGVLGRVANWASHLFKRAGKRPGPRGAGGKGVDIDLSDLSMYHMTRGGKVGTVWGTSSGVTSEDAMKAYLGCDEISTKAVGTLDTAGRVTGIPTGAGGVTNIGNHGVYALVRLDEVLDLVLDLNSWVGSPSMFFSAAREKARRKWPQGAWIRESPPAPPTQTTQATDPAPEVPQRDSYLRCTGTYTFASMEDDFPWKRGGGRVVHVIDPPSRFVRRFHRVRASYDALEEGLASLVGAGWSWSSKVLAYVPPGYQHKDRNEDQHKGNEK